MKEIRQAGLSLAEIARRSNVEYNRVWRAASGGWGGLEPEETARLQRALEAAQQSA
jgi:transcriptional regulator with XRE-family HTH domain